jgi:hypothetical protein
LQRQIIHEQALQIEQLKAHAHEPDNSSDSDGQNPPKKKKLVADQHSNGTSALRKDALQAGKRFAVCDILWPDPAAIRYVAIHNQGSESEPHEATESDEDEEVKVQAARIFRSLPANLRPYVKEAWFRERVSHLLLV